MTGWRSVTWLIGGSLIRQFAVLSFLVIGVTTAALSFVISQALRSDMLAREWQVTGGYIRLQAQEYLTPSDFADPHSDVARAHFRTFYQQVMRMPEIVRVKVYDRSQTVAWSDEPRLIGQRFVDNPQLARARRGETVAHLETGTKAENVFEQRRGLAELYVPLELPPAPGVMGIVETYKSTDEVFANIGKARRIVVGTALAGAALLWGSLFGIVRGASRRLELQHQALEQRTTELSAANDELTSVQARLVAAGRMAAIGEVVTAVAHGIRNPLANIRASAQVALLDCRDSEVMATATANLGNVISEVDRLASRVGELLRFVRPTERRAEALDLNEVLRRSVHSLAGRLDRTKVQVVEQLARAPAIVTGDPALLEQAFGAVLENSLDAMADVPGTLTVVSGTEPGPGGGAQVFAEIRDTGHGIQPEHLTKIFELFFTTKAQGTGLGLALARKFIEAYGGTLKVRSRPGHGAVFRATFPAA
jgi:signal transduction histidine kinase